MTSQNNPLFSQRGSALIVTMLLVSVLLATALILLQKIVPYAKSVRSMHDASQSYYVARGQTEFARLEFMYDISPVAVLRIPSLFGLLSQPGTNTESTTDTSDDRLIDSSDGLTVTEDNIEPSAVSSLPSNSGLKMTRIGSAFTGADGNRDLTINKAYAVVSQSSETPLKIKLNPTDTKIRLFGTSKTNQAFHTLNPLNAGGLRFDLRGVNTDNNFTLKMRFVTVPNTTKVTVKIQHELWGTVTTFTGEFSPTSDTLELLTEGNFKGNQQQIASSGIITATPDKLLATFLFDNNCLSADVCSLIFTVSNITNQPVDFRLITSDPIPDLNAVVIGDGLSGNGLYYQRIIDYIPTPQDI